MRTALVTGCTGLTGSRLLELLLEDSDYDRVIAVTRKPLSISHPKLTSVVVDFDKLEASAAALRCDDVFCCLGTTIRQAGSQEAFRKVDFVYPLEIGRITRAHGASRYFLLTALGSDAQSRIFYNRVKGEVEKAIQNLHFTTLHIFRPSMLLGPRTEARSGEFIGKVVMRIFDFAIPRKYKAIEASKVARAMVDAAHTTGSGVIIHDSAEMQSARP